MNYKVTEIDRSDLVQTKVPIVNMSCMYTERSITARVENKTSSEADPGFGVRNEKKSRLHRGGDVKTTDMTFTNDKTADAERLNPVFPIKFTVFF